MTKKGLDDYYRIFRKRYPELKEFKLVKGLDDAWCLMRTLTNGYIQQIRLGSTDSVKAGQDKFERAFIISSPAGEVRTRAQELIPLQIKYQEKMGGRGYEDPLVANSYWNPPHHAKLKPFLKLFDERDFDTNCNFLDEYINNTLAAAKKFENLENIYTYRESGLKNYVDFERLLFKALVKAPDFDACYDYYLWSILQTIDEKRYYLEHFFVVGKGIPEFVPEARSNCERDLANAMELLTKATAIREELAETWQSAQPLYASTDDYIAGYYATLEIWVLEDRIENGMATNLAYKTMLDEPTIGWPGLSGERLEDGISRARRSLFTNELVGGWCNIKLERLKCLNVDDGKEGKVPPNDFDKYPLPKSQVHTW